MFNDLINKIKVYAFHFWNFQMRGIKATRYRKNLHQNNGYFVDLTSGGNCGEGFIRISKGKKNYYYPNYFRNGQIRSNSYVLDVANIRHDNEQDAEIVYN